MILTPELSATFKQGANNSLVLNNPVNFSDLNAELLDTKDVIEQPQIKISRFDNDANFSIRLKDPGGTISTQNNKVLYHSSLGQSRIYQLSDGSFEFDTIISAKPISNVVEYTLQHKNVVAYYQPQLSAQEVLDGCVRPDDIVGSYAIYHASKRNNGFMAGKIIHIPKPWIKDSNNWQAWCELNIDLPNNLMTITIPQNFLDTAVYPLTLDPTIGNTTAGASNGSVSSAFMIGDGPFTPGSNGDATSISLYSNVTASQEYTAGLYDSSPSTLYRDTSGDTVSFSSGGSWNTFTLDSSYTISTAASYWLMYGCASSHTYFYDTGTVEGGFTNNHTYVTGAMPNPITMDNIDWGRIISIYATYTATGGNIVVSLAGSGGLAGQGGLAGTRGGLAR